ncbi:uncharacterized protein MYCFIDRAFT_34050, partial [Pseudocercospora fijiensis CIRAD86]
MTTSQNGSQVRYICLSYCWGAPTKSRSITVNGSRLMVTENLHSALSAIHRHHHHGTYYWIDAICINQDDIVERSRQVAQMWKIFASAEKVFAWLGDSDEESKLATETISRYGLRYGPESLRLTDQHIFTDQENAAVSRLTEREYFTRTWI